VTSVENTIKCLKHWRCTKLESEITMCDRMQMYNISAFFFNKHISMCACVCMYVGRKGGAVRNWRIFITTDLCTVMMFTHAYLHYWQVVLISKPVEEVGVATYIFGQAHSDFAQSTIEWPVLGYIITVMCISVG
jgi:hypothetical protein